MPWLDKARILIQKNNTMEVVILAGGQGKRMNQDVPKPLVELHGRPLISYLLDSVAEAEVCERPTIVVGYGADQVKTALGDGYRYVLQEQQLGTGHAVMVTQDELKHATHVMVLYADHPLLTSETIQAIAQQHIETGSTVTMATAVVPDFDDWREGFYNFGRIIRSADEAVQAIVEKKDATEEQLAIREVNPAYYCFKADWLWQEIDKLGNNNAQHEYYLTDLVAVACAEGEKITTVDITPEEALGANTFEQLEQLADVKKS